MKLGVVGSRSIDSQNDVTDAIINSPWHGYRTIVTGSVSGVDGCARTFAERYNVELSVKETDFSSTIEEDVYSRVNEQIVADSDVIVAIWDGQSSGTKDSIDRALEQNVPIYVEVFE